MQLVIHVGRSIERKRCEERITVGDARGGEAELEALNKKNYAIGWRYDDDCYYCHNQDVCCCLLLLCRCCVRITAAYYAGRVWGVGGVCCGPGVRPSAPSMQANLHLPSIKYSAIYALLKGESNAQSCVEFGCYLPNLADFVTKPDFRATPTPGRT